MILHVKVFRIEASVFAGQEPIESEEMKPQWFSISPEYLLHHGIIVDREVTGTRAKGTEAEVEMECGIPFDRMWLDDRQWFPWLLKGRKFEGQFLFRGHEEIVKMELKTE